MTDRTAQVVDEVARTSYGRLVAFLASTTGDLAEAEDAMGDALVAALTTWPLRGIPERPESWLLTAARRNLIDAARRRDVARRARADVALLIEQRADMSMLDAVPDRRLHLMFACAHPAVDTSMHSPLILQAVLGLDAARIAEAFLVPAATMGQRLVRVKAKIKEAGIPFRLPEREHLPARLDGVLEAIYAAYGLGWDDPSGYDSMRPPLAAEAVRLSRLVVSLVPEQAEAHGLLSLLLNLEARTTARRDDGGRFVPLDQQDVSLWSTAMVVEAEEQLAAASALRQIGPFQLMAAIQSVHNQRAVTGVTRWGAVVSLYDGLVALHPTVGAYVARAAAYRQTTGAGAALGQLDELPDASVRTYQPYWVLRAACLRDLRAPAEAERALATAVALTRDQQVAEHLRSVAGASGG